MVTKADEYRKRAKEADEKARRAKGAETKQVYTDLAAFWRELAEQAERHGR